MGRGLGRRRPVGRLRFLAPGSDLSLWPTDRPTTPVPDAGVEKAKTPLMPSLPPPPTRPTPPVLPTSDPSPLHLLLLLPVLLQCLFHLVFDLLLLLFLVFCFISSNNSLYTSAPSFLPLPCPPVLLPFSSSFPPPPLPLSPPPFLLFFGVFKPVVINDWRA